jgi:predicted nucleic acid-binding protein
MPLEEVDVIDMITQRGSDGRYGLIVTDEGVTTEPGERLALLQRKLLTYREAVMTGELAETCPGALPGDFFVQVVCERRPTREMLNITDIITQTQPPIEIPVLFTEFPEGSWGLDEPVEPEEGPMLSEEMQEAVKAAFAAAAKWLADDQVPLFVYWHEGEEQTLAAITEAKDQEEVLARVMAWARKLGNEAHLCIQMSAVKTAEGLLPADRLMATCCERGELEGFVLTQEIGMDARTGNLELRGEVKFVEVCPNFFPAD